MITRILSTAAIELRIARRNRWVMIAVAMMVLFSLVLSAAGTAPTGALGTDSLSAVVASLISLSVYLVPLVALLMSFEAIAGEVERGTLPLLLTYPVARWEILAGKALAHLVVLTIALAAGYGAAAILALAADPGAIAGLPNLWRLLWTSAALGVTFLGFGYTLSSLSRRTSGAAGLAIGLWLVLVVLYDLGLLAAVVADDGGVFTRKVFPALLLLNPADAFRLFNLSTLTDAGVTSGIGGAAFAIPAWQSLASTLLWPLASLGLASLAFRKVTP